MVTDDLLAKHTRNNVFPELLIEKESVRYTFINMKPVWFDLEQLLYLKRKNYGEGLSRVDLSQLTVVALVRVWQSSTHWSHGL